MAADLHALLRMVDAMLIQETAATSPAALTMWREPDGSVHARWSSDPAGKVADIPPVEAVASTVELALSDLIAAVRARR